jgi:hypothetical protein
VVGATYKPVPNQVLFNLDASGPPIISTDLTNVYQGDAGDCYFLAALMAVARRNPDAIKNMIRDNGNGTYSATFFSKYDGKPGPVTATVNGDLPYDSKGVIFENAIENINGKNVSWAAILEKLWAAANGNKYDNIDGQGNSDINDHDVHNGIYALTGKVAVDRNPGGPMTGITIDQAKQDFDNGIIVIGTADVDGALTGDHSLAVLAVDVAAQTITFGDPGERAPVTIPYSTFTNTNANQYSALPTYP